MPKKEDEVLDPIVVAALIDDGNEDEADKEAKKNALDEADENAGDGEDEDESKEDPKEKDSKEDESKEKEEDPKEEKKAEDDPDEEKKEELSDSEKSDQEKQSRKEKREERRKAFMESLKPKEVKDPRADLIKGDPNYKPLDYEKADEFKADELKTDREKAAQNAFAKGAEIERNIQAQERFWDNNSRDEEILYLNPEFQFLNPDNKSEYNEKRVTAINQMYLQTIGYREDPLYDPTTRQPLIGQDGKQLVRPSAARTDIPYKTFVEGYVASMEDYAEDQALEETTNIVKQQNKQGVRPGGGGNKRSKPSLTPGVFRDMSDEDFEKYDKDTDEELLSAFQ